MQKNRWIKWLFLAVVAVMMTACGGGGSTGGGLSAQQKAINLIVAYAESNGTTEAPDADDYADAGVVNSDDVNVTAINNYIAHLAAEDKRPENQDDILAIAEHFGIALYHTLVFAKKTLDDGEEPWITNGTTAGTRQLKNVNNTPNSSSPIGGITIGDHIYFSTSVSNRSTKIWKTNGVTTTMLYEDTQSSRQPTLMKFQNKLYVIHHEKLLKINDAGTALELIKEIGRTDTVGDHVLVGDDLYFISGYSKYTIWKTDGTVGGTIAVKSNFKGGFSLVLSGGLLYFTAETTSTGRELWVLDPATDDSAMFADHYSGADSSYPEYLTDVNGKLYFSASEDRGGTEICTVNGATIGCLDLYPDTIGSYPRNLTALDGTLYFIAANNDTDGRELWRVADASSIPVRVGGDHVSDVKNLKVMGNTLYFSIRGRELHAFDAESNTSALFKEIEGELRDITVRADGEFYFLVKTASWLSNDAYTLWHSDGTSEGTTIVRENSDDFGFSRWKSTFLAMLDGNVYFPALDAAHGTELWRSNGTQGGTSLFKDIDTTNQSSLEDIVYEKKWHLKIGYTHYFVAQNAGYKRELWMYDGIDTVCISRDKNLSVRGELTNYHGTLYFVANDHIHGEELWMSDGTADGMMMVKNIKEETPHIDGSSYPHNLTVINDKLYFSAIDDMDRQLWSTDGITIQRETSFTGDKVGIGYPGAGVAGVDDVVYFLTAPTDDKTELWKKEGNSVMQLSHFTYGFSKIEHLTIMGDTAYFIANNDGSGKKLWKTNATGVEEISGSYFLISSVVVHQNKLYFSAYTAAGARLWTYDGSVLQQVSSDEIFLSYIQSTGDTLYFINSSSGNTGKVWKVENDVISLVKDFNEGGLSYAYLSFLGAINNTLIFRGKDSTDGISKLWKSDGTDEGTIEIYPHDGF